MNALKERVEEIVADTSVSVIVMDLPSNEVVRVFLDVPKELVVSTFDLDRYEQEDDEVIHGKAKDCYDALQSLRRDGSPSRV